jgi:Uma2 family endonuclease
LRWTEGRKLILVEGEILEMAAPGPLHMTSQGLVENWLRTVFPDAQFWIRNQGGLALGINTDPLPDVAVVPGTPRSYAQHPSTALLVIEIADSSLAFDTGDKASLYAAAGIEDYWVIDVNDRRLHVFRGPTPDPARKYGHWYSQVTVLKPADTVAPLAAPGSSVAVGDLLP